MRAKQISLALACVLSVASGCTSTEEAVPPPAFFAEVSYRSNVPSYGDDLGKLVKTEKLEVNGDRAAIAEAILKTVTDADLGKPGDAVQFEWHVGSDLYEILLGPGKTMQYSGRFSIYTGNGMLHISKGIGDTSESKERFLEGLRRSLMREGTYSIL